jgi:hypothetical protein
MHKVRYGLPPSTTSTVPAGTCARTERLATILGTQPSSTARTVGHSETARPITNGNTTRTTHRSTSATGSACHATSASPDGARRAAAAAAPASVRGFSFLARMPVATPAMLGHRQRSAVCRQASRLTERPPSTHRAFGSTIAVTTGHRLGYKAPRRCRNAAARGPAPHVGGPGICPAERGTRASPPEACWRWTDGHSRN